MRQLRYICVFLCLLALAAMPAAAANLDDVVTITGFIDNHIRYIDNVSTIEEDNKDPNIPNDPRADNGNLTTDDDEQFSARTRGRLFFNISPNPFSKAVFGFEFDQTWGQDGTDGAGASTGFDLGNDNNVFELIHLYVDLKVPSTPLRFEIGGFGINGTRLKRCVVFCDDGGGIAMTGSWTSQIQTYTWFIIAEEELIENGPDSFGEDYTVGTRVEFAPYKGFDLDLFLAFYNIEGPSSDSSSLMVGSCSVGRDGGAGGGGLQCFERDTRYYVGLDAQWKFGNFSFAPTFIFTFGERQLAGGGEADIESFLFDVRGDYTAGPFTLSGKFVYISGNEASDDLGDGSDLKFWQNISVTTVHRSVQWFELLGFNMDTTSEPTFGFNNSRALKSAGTFDQFGLIHPAVKVDYKVAKPLTATAAVGLFLTAEDVGVPARFGGTPPPSYNFAGGENNLGTEVDAWLTWEAFKGTTIEAWFAYAFIGDAHNLCEPGTGGTTGAACIEREAKDQIGVGARMLYRF